MLNKHGVHWDEVNQVMASAPQVLRGAERDGERRYRAVGRTTAGRRLKVVFRMAGDTAQSLPHSRRATEEMRKAKTIPRFRSEAEERAFWDTHDPDEYMTEPVDVIWDIRPLRKRRVTMRVELEVVDGLQDLAQGHEVRYQTLARGLIRRGVRQLQESG